jgi:hypothetical protein
MMTATGYNSPNPSGGSEYGGPAFERATQDAEGRELPRRVEYSAAYNSTANAPSGPLDGLKTRVGRVFAEARSVTSTVAVASLAVTLIATDNGVRCAVEATGTTITAGSVRFWVFDEDTQKWSLGGVDETLPTGAESVTTTDQFVTVGSR